MREEKGKPKERNLKYIWTTKDWMLCVFPDNNNKVVWGKTWLRADCCWHFIYFTMRSYCLKSTSCTLYNEALMKQAHSANCKLQSNPYNSLFIYAGTLLIVYSLSFFLSFLPLLLFPETTHGCKKYSIIKEVLQHCTIKMQRWQVKCERSAAAGSSRAETAHWASH